MSDILNDINSFLARNTAGTGRTVTPSDQIGAFVDQNKPKAKEKKKILRVIDGDTLDVEGIGHVRLVGLNTPETVDPRKGVEPGGPEATAYMKKLAEGKDASIFFSDEKKDKYGRSLACVH